MNLDDIPADVIMEMTPELQRLFRFANCEPQCHICYEELEVGKQFQLMSYDGTDEMVCDLHTREDLEQRRQKTKDKAEAEKLEARLWREEYLKKHPKAGLRLEGGYSRPSLEVEV